MGQCPGCKEWNTFVEEKTKTKTTGSGMTGRAVREAGKPSRLSEIALKDEERAKPTTGMLANLPDARLLENQALFGKMFYDSREHRICMQPFSIVTEQAIIRLAY